MTTPRQQHTQPALNRRLACKQQPDEDWLGNLRGWVTLCRSGMEPREAWILLRD